MTCESDFLAQLQDILENAYGYAERFQARDLKLTEFDHISDEEQFRAEENYVEETLEIESMPDPVDLSTDANPVEIAAVDTSSLVLGDTDQGTGVAIRGAVIVQRPDRFETHILGPYVAHVTPSNAREIYAALRKALGMTQAVSEPSLFKIVDRIRNMIERLAQRYANNMISNGIILWDGALTRSMDTPKEVFDESFGQATARSNRIVSITKTTRLWLRSDRRLLDAFSDRSRSEMCEIPTDRIRTNPRDILGTVHVVRFSPNGFSFRVDVNASSGHCCDVIRQLRGNCQFRYGYPEPLCRAHINAYFTPAEGMALQGMFVDRHCLQIIPAFNLRTYVFGPFGG
jgi:hypothetical protein